VAKFEVRRSYNQPLIGNEPSWVLSHKFGTCLFSDDHMALIKTDANAYHLVEQSKCGVEWKRTE
jgi:hypothetical protein